MATEIIMPKAGMAMEEGKIVRWLKNVGDKIEAGEGIMEIETDKITMENESPVDGVLLAKLYEDGTTVPVITVIGYVGKEGEKVPDAPAASAAPVPAPEAPPAPSEVLMSFPPETPVAAVPAASARAAGDVKATPYARTLAKENGVALGAVTPTGANGVIKARDISAAPKATPLAQRIASDKGIDLGKVAGSGYNGKIMSGDLPASAAAAMAMPMGEPVVKPMSGMRKVVAARMMQSHLQIPPVTQNMKVYVDELLALRAKMNANREEKITINDLIIKACAKAVAESEVFRTQMNPDKNELVVMPGAHIGMAVGMEEGLLVPVIRNADLLTLSQVSAVAKDMATRARAGQLKPEEYEGSTFTISNVGSYGVYTFTPIINQPNAGIMGINCINDELVLENGQVAVKKYLMLSLTFDHRIIDGAAACVFQNRVKTLLENPLEFLI